MEMDNHIVSLAFVDKNDLTAFLKFCLELIRLTVFI